MDRLKDEVVEVKDLLHKYGPLEKKKTKKSKPLRGSVKSSNLKSDIS